MIYEPILTQPLRNPKEFVKFVIGKRLVRFTSGRQKQIQEVKWQKLVKYIPINASD